MNLLEVEPCSASRVSAPAMMLVCKSVMYTSKSSPLHLAIAQRCSLARVWIVFGWRCCRLAAGLANVRNSFLITVITWQQVRSISRQAHLI